MNDVNARCRRGAAPRSTTKREPRLFTARSESTSTRRWPFAELIVRQRVEPECRRLTPRPCNHIVLRATAQRNAFVRWIRHLEQECLDTLIELRETGQI